LSHCVYFIQKYFNFNVINKYITDMLTLSVNAAYLEKKS
jgi:hypothetical protein